MSIESADNILHVKNSTMRISRVEVGQTLSVGNIEFDNPTTLTSVTSNGNNTTPYTVSFSNVTTGLATTANIDVGGELTVSGNVQVGTANLFVDTVSSNIGVGTNLPLAKLDVKGDIGLVGKLRLTNTANTAQNVELSVGNRSNAYTKINKLFSDITGIGETDRMGTCIAISGDGKVIAASAPYDEAGAGAVYILSLIHI